MRPSSRIVRIVTDMTEATREIAIDIEVVAETVSGTESVVKLPAETGESGRKMLTGMKK